MSDGRTFERAQLIESIQKLVCDLLTPLVGNKACVGAVVVIGWRDGDADLIAGVHTDMDADLRERMGEYYRKVISGEKGVVGEYETKMPVKS